MVDRSRPLVSLDRVSFEFDSGAPVLDGLTLAVPEGATVGVVGPSGCGKSTLLSILAGFRTPTSGIVTWRPDEQHRHPRSMVFQQDTVLPWLTAADNIGLHFRFSRSREPKAEIARRIAELVSLGGLEGAEDRYPYQLSGGMRRRVAFLASVAARPRTLLLDEPFSSLDEPTRVAIHQDVFTILRQMGTTVILVTHDLAEAISLCDRVAILTRRPARVFESYDVPFGNQRNMLALRQTPPFLELYGTLWEKLSMQIEPRQTT